jgi:hypothetical protein
MAQNSGYASAGMGFIDGVYVRVSEMRLPITDMGFQLGDMCYDAIHVHKDEQLPSSRCAALMDGFRLACASPGRFPT